MPESVMLVAGAVALLVSLSVAVRPEPVGRTVRPEVMSGTLVPPPVPPKEYVKPAVTEGSNQDEDKVGEGRLVLSMMVDSPTMIEPV